MNLPSSGNLKLALTAILSTSLLTGCAAPLVVGAAASAGYIGLQNRPTRQIAADSELKAQIKQQLVQSNFAYLTDIGIDVYYADVLLTGVVPTNAEGERVLTVIRQTPGVKKVYNELFVGAAYTAGQKAKDAWIAAQIQPRLLGAKDAYPLNYLITTVNNHVYIMGDTATQGEKDHVLHILRTTRGVQQVHDYLNIKSAVEAQDRPGSIPQKNNPLPVVTP